MKTSWYQRKVNEKDVLTGLLLVITLFTVLFLFLSPMVFAGNDNALLTPWQQKCFSFQILYTR